MSFATKLLNKCYKITHPVVGEIWCLHRVVPQRTWALPNRELEITPQFLEQLIEQCGKDVQFVTLDQLYDKRDTFRCHWQKKMINISFDDGFKDIYTYAYPIFRKYNIPFTIYLTTDFPDNKVNLWWIHLEQIIATHDVLSLTDGQVLSCHTESEKANVYHQVCQQIYDASQIPAEMFGALLEPYVQKAWNTKPYVLTWEDLAEMKESGLLTIGSHTVSHPMLNKVSDDQVKEELTLSKNRICQMLSVTPRHLSYPHSAIDNRVVQFAEQMGYLSATLGYGGAIRKDDNVFKWNRKYIVQA